MKKVEARLPIAGKNRIGGKLVGAAKIFESVNPCDPKQVIGRFPAGTAADAHKAIDAAHKAFPAWSGLPAAERVAAILRISAILRRRKHEFSAMMVLEESKSWPEADGDTAEAIDYCEFYARDAERLAEPQPLTPLPGEQNALEYLPLGVCAVIPPWNFPLAILTGMTTAALVSGNTVVLKPSSDAAGIATMFVEACEESGLPDGVLNVVMGGGSTVGNALVESPKTRLIAFTGSREVGVEISEKAGKVTPGQIWIKRAILEMGGKDFILVDETADLEDAANGIVAAAFGFQGQKCSACSRLIVHQKVHKPLLAKVVAKTKTLSVGDVRDPKNSVGAVINAGAQKKILEYLAIGKKEGRIVAGGKAGPKSGYFVMPTIVDGIKP
ncbi:MAG TPA: aldehyde dehydrogenase family protein, partial [Thermoanaerobaculia bacterium]